MILSLLLGKAYSQEICQQTTIELDEALDESQTYLYEATKSIELLPGFGYNPTLNNKMEMEIDRYSVFPPTEGVYGGNDIGEDCVVGSLPGTINVSNTGAATYSIDIQMPSALGSMAPKLALSYNSQAADGIMGWSWDLLGLSSIERVGQTEYHDGRTTNVDFVNDRYAIDGNRLMNIGGNEYKTEIDNLDKIVSSSVNVKNPGYFVVWKSDGTIWEYGTTEDSKIETQTDGNVVLKWLVSKITDRNGNAITYHYYENRNTGESVIESIEYASNKYVNAEPAYRVSFEYKDKLDTKTAYVHGNMVSNTKILDKIEVYNNDSGKKIIEYSLKYDPPGFYNNMYYLHYRLKSIQLTIDGEKINPTNVMWNSQDKWATIDDCGYNQYELDKTIFNKYSFVGDFNGDGFSDVLLVPYKIQDTYSANVDGEVYLNNGDGSFAKEPLMKVTFNKNLDWIYVVDIDGNGKDDIIPYETYYNELGAFDFAKFSILVMSDGKFLNKQIFRCKNPVTILPGNYVDKNSSGLLVFDAYNGSNNDNLAKYIHVKKGAVISEDIKYSEIISGRNINCLAFDMSGDGISELLSLSENGYSVYKIKKAETLSLELYCIGFDMTKDIYPFPNDYNGDGKIDLLYYDPAKFWNVVISKGSKFGESVPCANNIMLRNIRLNSKDRYCYSLKEMNKPTVMIRTADFDGDGTADVGVFNNNAGNYYLEIGFSPYKTKDANINFLYQRRYYMPINYTHQTIQLGRFLPQENISILSGLTRKPSNYSKPYIVSLCSNSAYYSVEKIVDGMGNSTELTYDYLIEDQKDDFYTCVNRTNYYGVENRSVPILALKEVRSYNINDKPVVKKYNYYNAMLHKTGHGFIGFESVVTRNYIDDKLVNKQLQEYKLEPMDKHCIPLLTSDKLFYGENQLIKEHYYEYKKYLCKQNEKVIIPLLLQDREAVYNVDKNNVVLKNIVTVNTYESDLDDGKYNKIVQLKMTRKGYDDIKSIDPEKCQYLEEINMLYENDVVNWVINRPKKIVKSVIDKENAAVGNVHLIEYNSDNPMQVAKETVIPNVNADIRDSLTLVVKYKYDRVGNVVEQTISSPSLKEDKIVKSEYGEEYQYRYKTKSIDEIGRIVTCKYNEFGMLESTIDYNGYMTVIENEPFGTRSTIMMPDGMKNVKALLWSENNKYAPENATYYSWEKNVGKSETMVFYHKSGMELRTVTFDINGEAIIVDKMYDDYGNIKQMSYPYYENDDKLFIVNVYDMYNRMIETDYPNGLNVTRSYDGNDVLTEYLAADAIKKYKKEVCNFMGWVTNVYDNGDNEIKYEYYSDGKLKSAQMGENSNNRITVTYDNLRNRSSIFDPNYGLMLYENDVLGNVRKITNAQNIIEMDYDVLGRKVLVKENDLVHGTKNVVQWVYSRDKGTNGLLSKVLASNNHQIEYRYDDKLRLLNTIETINGIEYETSYSYDEANRISTIIYPSGFGVLKKYSNSGYEKMICDVKTQSVLWETNKTNSNGNITDFRLGNGLKTHYTYNPYDYMIESIVTKKRDEVLQDMSYKYDIMCNLIYRCDNVEYNYEKFEYDSYDRLTAIILNDEIKGKMNYDLNGNILYKEVDGVRVMYNSVYDSHKPNALTNLKSDDYRMYKRSRQNVEYSSFDNVVAIDEANKSIFIDYGYNNDRIYMKTVVDGNVKTKTYVGNCEYVVDGGKKKVLTYLEGPMGIFAVHVNDGEEYINYVHKDNLESWNIITDDEGRVLEKMSFDAWGNMRDPKAWGEECKKKELLFDRGFTGHEHLVDFGLINMNGRLYDPLMSMMLSPDNNIQMPKSSQNFNRYSYCMNNPLKYYDPTGEWVESVVLGVVGGASNLVFNARNIDSFGEAALLFGAGFVKGFLTEYTLGQSWFMKVGVGIAMEGLMSGVNHMVSIGDGSFSMSGDDWNSVKSSSLYGLGSGLVKSVMFTYTTEPSDTEYGYRLFDLCWNGEVGYGMISLVAHGMGCWFGGQPFLSTMRFKDVGFDLKMLGIVARRLMSSYLSKLDLGEKALDKRAQDLKNAILNDIRSEDPECPDFEYICELLGVFVEDFRIYVVGNIFQMIPGEQIECYPKPYYEEVITFPFSYSLFKSLFFDNE